MPLEPNAPLQEGRPVERRLGPSTVWILLAGSAGSLLLAQRSPLPQGDGLRDTLAILPLVVALLAYLGRTAPGSRRYGRWWRRSWAVPTAIGWLLLALTRTRLGFSIADPAIVAAGACLLLTYAGQLTLAFRPLLGQRLPANPSLVFFVLPFTVYLALLPWSTAQRPPDGDEPWYLLVTHSLAFDLDADLTNNYAARDYLRFIDRDLEPQPGDPRGPNGELYSRHNELLPLVLAPGYRVAGKFGALVTMAALTAALAWMTLRTARHYVADRPGGMLAAWACMALAPPLLLYSYQVWVEVPAALLTLIALDRIRNLGRDGRWSDWLVCAVALVLLPTLKLRFGLLAAPLIVLAAWHTRHRLRRQWIYPALLGTAVTVAGVLILLYNRQLYGNALKIHHWSELQLHRQSLPSYLLRLVGLFWDPAFGLFAVAPLWLLVVPAALLAMRRERVLLLDGLVTMSAYFLVVASRREWFGGWSPPFRYGLVLLPFLAILLAPIFQHRHRFGRRLLLVGLGTLTLALTLLWVAVPGWTFNFASGSSLVLDHLQARLGIDLLRFLPSAVRPRTATAVVPVLVTVLVVALWWLPLRQRRLALTLGIALSLVSPTVIAGLARKLPVRIVEAEATWVRKIGGESYPPWWELDRPRFREGWILRQGDRLDARLVAGGSLVRPRVLIRNLQQDRGSVAVDLLVDGREASTFRLPDDDDWQDITLDPIPWPSPSSVLSLRVRGERRPQRGVIVDRIVLSWS